MKRIIGTLLIAIVAVGCSHQPKYVWPASFERGLEKTLPRDDAECLVAYAADRYSWPSFLALDENTQNRVIAEAASECSS